MNKYLYLAVIIGYIFISCDRRPEKGDAQDARTFSVRQLIEHVHDTGAFDGTVLVADSTGIVYKGAFGLADRSKNIPLSPETKFYLASVSKQFTATAILLLVQQGKIRLDETITLYMEELPDLYKPITFRHLLTHTSGIPDYYEFAKPHEGFTNEDVLYLLKEVERLEFEPGSRYKYSNSGYVLLSILVDRITDTTFAHFLKENVFKKAGLDQTIVFDEQAPAVNNKATGYGRDSTLTDYRFRTTGGGGIYSNAEDLYQWHKALVNNKIIDKRIKELAYQPYVLKNDSTAYYGFGWNIDPENPDHVYHAGELEGFRTFFDRYLDKDIAIILLSNNSSGILKPLAEEIYRLLNSKKPGTSSPALFIIYQKE